MRGQVLAAKWGLELRLTESFPDLLPQLAAWVEQHHTRWPGLGALVGARVTIRGKDGEIVERIKDDHAWAALNNIRS